MNFKQIEDEALRLSKDERAELAQRLLLSIDAPTKSEIEEDWLLTAQHRAKDIDDGIVQPIPAEKVRQKALAFFS